MSNLSLPILELIYCVYKETYSINILLPKKSRFTIGQSIEKTLLNIIENLVYAKNSPTPIKTTYLLKTQGDFELLAFQLRLLLELKLISETRIFQLQSMLEEAGRMLGGWKKSLQ